MELRKPVYFCAQGVLTTPTLLSRRIGRSTISDNNHVKTRFSRQSSRDR